MRKKQWILLGAFLLFAVVAFLFSPAGGPGFSRDAMQQAEDAAFGYELPYTPVTLVQDEVIEWQDPGMEYAVRQLLEKPEGDILESDLAHIVVLDLYCNSAEGTGSVQANAKTLTHLTAQPPTLPTISYELSEETPWIRKLDDLRHFVNLRQLSIDSMNQAEGTHMDPVDLSGLSHCHDLQVLTIGGLKTENMEALIFCDALAVLELIDVPMDSLELLGRLSSLQNLKLYGYDLPDLSPLANLHELKTLNLSRCRIGSLEPLAQMRALKNLKLDGAMYPSLEPLAGTTLEALSLNCETMAVGTDAYDHLDYAPLTKIPTLVWLDLANHRNVDAALCTAILENAPGLQYLRIDRTPAAHELPEPDSLLFYGNAY